MGGERGGEWTDEMYEYEDGIALTGVLCNTGLLFREPCLFFLFWLHSFNNHVFFSCLLFFFQIICVCAIVQSGRKQRRWQKFTTTSWWNYGLYVISDFDVTPWRLLCFCSTVCVCSYLLLLLLCKNNKLLRCFCAIHETMIVVDDGFPRFFSHSLLLLLLLLLLL